jgi:hypothetical protein
MDVKNYTTFIKKDRKQEVDVWKSIEYIVIGVFATVCGTIVLCTIMFPYFISCHIAYALYEYYITVQECNIDETCYKDVTFVLSWNCLMLFSYICLNVLSWYKYESYRNDIVITVVFILAGIYGYITVDDSIRETYFYWNLMINMCFTSCITFVAIVCKLFLD